MKPKYDFHIHTTLCGHADSRQQISTIISYAETLGMEAIAITEHLGQKEDLSRIDLIREELKKYKPKCRVLVGAEIEADRTQTDGRLSVTDNFEKLDLIIGSIHYLPGTNIMPRHNQIIDIPDKIILERWQSTLIGIVCNPAVSILAHPGAMIANALQMDDWPDEVLDIFKKAAELSVAHQTAWEINNLIGKKLNGNLRKSYWKILKLAMDVGVKLTYASDAHCPEDIGATNFVDYITEKLGQDHLFDYSVYKKEVVFLR